MVSRTILAMGEPVLVYGLNVKKTAMGCMEQTFAGLAGIGDLIVTATSVHSRNNRCGNLMGKGVAPDDAVKQVGMVVEALMQFRRRWRYLKDIVLRCRL